MRLITRLFQAPQGQSFFLFGPRGTGKSTWLRQAYPEAVYVDLLDQEAFRTYLARPERLGEVVEGNPKARAVIVNGLNFVTSLLESRVTLSNFSSASIPVDPSSRIRS